MGEIIGSGEKPVTCKYAIRKALFSKLFFGLKKLVTAIAFLFWGSPDQDRVKGRDVQRKWVRDKGI